VFSPDSLPQDQQVSPLLFLRLIDFVDHSIAGLRVIKKKKAEDREGYDEGVGRGATPLSPGLLPQAQQVSSLSLPPVLHLENLSRFAP